MTYDVLGIGFGPSNIALAIAMDEGRFDGSALFVERASNSFWHQGMLLEGTDIQNNPLRDLITPVNPQSRYTFVNFLHKTGRLFHHLNMGRVHPLRRDYFDYVSWVAKQFDNVRYGHAVTGVAPCVLEGKPAWRVKVDGQELFARRLVLGVGRNLNVPKQFELSRRVVHFTDYLHAIESLPKDTPIAVVGASQSAVEILNDLLGRGFERIRSIHRTFSYRLKDTSPFSDEVYFPEFVDYYHRLSPSQRARLDEQVRPTNYSSVDGDILDALYQRVYEMKLYGREPLAIVRCTEVEEVIPSADAITLKLREQYTGVRSEMQAGLVILATGFLDVGRNGRDGLPHLLRPHWDAFAWQGDCLDVGRDYRITAGATGVGLPALYLNGLCESSHGLGDAGSFSLVSVRAQTIFNSIQGSV
ncbi:SidA/IucD/PvdA family monooxygenase [Paraburkholderia sp. BCC1876]|uniref:SidA/IucD/PvdA family monooxygenase n=1 Tax=Paraburkholderia sp. BCC1876 TaxID=2676303 RepID=UPI001591467F|nr:SidA/IucD/PvdA family monooxygenase [Paraburkholderia sp. BCC1876]